MRRGIFCGWRCRPDMPLRLVDVQHLLDLKVQGAVEMGQTFRDVLMYRGLTDAEFRGGGADRGPVLYDVKSQTFRPLFHITLQSATLPRLLLLYPMRRKAGLCGKGLA